MTDRELIEQLVARIEMLESIVYGDPEERTPTQTNLSDINFSKFLRLAHKIFSQSAFTLKDALNKCDGAVNIMQTTTDKAITPQSIGMVVKNRVGTDFDGLMIQRAGNGRGGVAVWQVTPTEAAF